MHMYIIYIEYLVTLSGGYYVTSPRELTIDRKGI